jgi:hypothetical protein
MTEIRIEMSAAELRVMIKEAVGEALADVGIHIDNADRVEDARADLRFLRRIRLAVDGAGIWIARSILTALVGGMVTLLVMGVKSWVVK